MASFHDLFSHNMDEVLQEVFLLLSPGCLHRARQVCHQWNQFILGRLWGSRVGRRRLRLRLEEKWRKEKPLVSSKDF